MQVRQKHSNVAQMQMQSVAAASKGQQKSLGTNLLRQKRRC
jgi:hypothetical protein